MKRVLSSSTALFCFIFCLCHEGYAGNGHATGQPVVDSIQPKATMKVKVTVRDQEDGSYIGNVSVAIGSRKGQTDSKGVVELDSVKAGYPVIISKAGYYAQSKKQKPELQFRLLKKEGQTNVFSINNGLYQRPLEHISGSAVVVSGNDLRKVDALDFAAALSYYVPSFIMERDNLYGSSPNQTPDIKIRNSYNFPASATVVPQPGVTGTGVQVNPSSGDFVADNIAHNSQPTFFVNGVQVTLQSALDLDINRIEKVTILKDAAATAAYGVRGGHGIVLIETVRPQEGKMRVSYSGQVQVTEANLTSYNMMTAQEKLDLERENGFYSMNPALLQARQKRVDQGLNTDWLNLPLRRGMGSKHTVALEGGNDDTRYGLDFSYNDVEGAMKGANRKASNFGAYISNRFKNVTLRNHLTFQKVDAANSPYGSFDAYTRQNGYWNPYDSVSGKMAKLMEEVIYQGDTLQFYNPAYNGTLSTKDESDYSRLANTTNIDWSIGKGFQLNGLVAYSQQSDQVNQYLPPNHTDFANYAPADFFKRGWYNQVNSKFSSLEAALRLNYQKKFDRHQVYASAGASALQTESEAAGVSVAGFTSDKLSDLAFGSAYATTRPETGKIVTRLASGFGNLAYSYDNRYQAEFSGNADASSQFGDNHQLVRHWSAGASWNLHQERFFRGGKLLDQLRLRASVGTAGDNSYLSYLGRTTFHYYTDKQYVSAGSNSGTRGIGLGTFLTGMANDNIWAPETYTENIGLDAVLLQNRLYLSVEAYRQQSTRLILPLVSPTYTGFQGFSYYDNLGAIKNKGIEFSLNYFLIRNTAKSIYWNFSFNGLHNEEHIAAIGDYLEKVNAINDNSSIGRTNPQHRYVVGESLTGIWAVRSMGIDPQTAKEVYLKNDGTETVDWSAADKWLVGDRAPKLRGSFGTSASYKNISLGVYCNYQYDVQGYNQTLVDKVENADLLYNTDLHAASNRWKQTGDQALYKPVYMNGWKQSPTYVSSRFVQANDQFNLATVSLGYALPQRITARLRAQSIKLGLMGNNLFRWQAMEAEQGIYYPFQRQYTFSVHTSF